MYLMSTELIIFFYSRNKKKVFALALKTEVVFLRSILSKVGICFIAQNKSSALYTCSAKNVLHSH
jgi:hypothetical protein